jgi:hypothetical protein
VYNWCPSIDMDLVIWVVLDLPTYAANHITIVASCANFSSIYAY